MEGAAFLTKADTMARADRSGLTSKPGAVYGARRYCPQTSGAVTFNLGFRNAYLPTGHLSYQAAQSLLEIDFKSSAHAE